MTVYNAPLSVGPCFASGGVDVLLESERGLVRKIERSALVMYSDEQMYSLVNDIEAYPQFMAGCSGAEILQRDDTMIEARLELSKAGIQQNFVTRNTLDRPRSMQMCLVEGPFSHFEGVWQFKALNATACKVTLTMEFEFTNKVLDLAAGKWFDGVANQQVESLCERARTIYG